MKKTLKSIYLFIGFLALGLGILGIFLPVLPTVPFLLLTLYCFARGSAKFHNWFAGTRIYKIHLEEFVETRAMTLKAKLGICIPVSIMLVLSIIFVPLMWAKIAVTCVMLLKWLYFTFRIKTLYKKSNNKITVWKQYEK